MPDNENKLATIEPETREETFLQDIADGTQTLTPAARKEEFLRRIAAKPGVPSITESDEGKVLMVESGEAAWSEAASGVFIIHANNDMTQITDSSEYLNELLSNPTKYQVLLNVGSDYYPSIGAKDRGIWEGYEWYFTDGVTVKLSAFSSPTILPSPPVEKVIIIYRYRYMVSGTVITYHDSGPTYEDVVNAYNKTRTGSSSISVFKFENEDPAYVAGMHTYILRTGFTGDLTPAMFGEDDTTTVEILLDLANESFTITITPKTI